MQNNNWVKSVTKFVTVYSSKKTVKGKKGREKEKKMENKQTRKKGNKRKEKERIEDQRNRPKKL